MKKIFRFIGHRSFWLNLAFAALVVIGIVWGTFRYLDSYTLHGESVSVPDLRELSVDDAQNVLESRNLSAEIIDSVYSDNDPRGVVVVQKPEPNARVKKGRTIFLTMNSTVPEKVSIPDLEGKSLRIALSLLEVVGIKVEELEYEPDETCTDCVLEIRYQDEPIEPGERIRKGDKITLVLGRQTNARVSVPNLLGLGLEEAQNKLEEKSLNFGAVLRCDGCTTEEDTARAQVYLQSPSPSESSFISLGSRVDVYLTMDSTRVESVLDTTRVDSL